MIQNSKKEGRTLHITDTRHKLRITNPKSHVTRDASKVTARRTRRASPAAPFAQLNLAPSQPFRFEHEQRIGALWHAEISASHGAETVNRCLVASVMRLVAIGGRGGTCF